jgi:hypothetical protein
MALLYTSGEPFDHQIYLVSREGSLGDWESAQQCRNIILETGSVYFIKRNSPDGRGMYKTPAYGKFQMNWLVVRSVVVKCNGAAPEIFSTSDVCPA